ncbi:GNAT family N-acetyltransferase [Flavobacterium sp.]|uniref:GNAT family N-acetyltransferase n=1 Tax=Flavobacterium sp. TaxID=239 RepID=UPI003D2AFBCC
MQFILANPSHLSIIKDLAYAIWPSTYGEILSQEQLTYMLSMFYSETALKQQMEEKKHVFYIAVNNDDKNVGFVSYEINCEPQKTKIHKIYVLPETQGTGVGKLLFNLVIEKAKENNQKTVYLNVNKYNNAKLFYEKLGFVITIEEVIDIGNNYIMDDYVMEIEVN